jgi:hypothetical protein
VRGDVFKLIEDENKRAVIGQSGSSKYWGKSLKRTAVV